MSLQRTQLKTLHVMRKHARFTKAWKVARRRSWRRVKRRKPFFRQAKIGKRSGRRDSRKDCGPLGVWNPKVRYLEAQKEQILKAYPERTSLRAIRRIFGVSIPTVRRWIQKTCYLPVLEGDPFCLLSRKMFWNSMKWAPLWVERPRSDGYEWNFANELGQSSLSSSAIGAKKLVENSEKASWRMIVTVAVITTFGLHIRLRWFSRQIVH